MARNTRKNNSISFARQSAFTTENTTPGDFTAFPCQWEFDHAREQEDFSDYSSGQVGAFVPPAPGTKDGGKITTRFPIRVFKNGYDPTAEDPGDAGVISPELVLLAAALGSGGATSVASAAEFAQGLHMTRSAYIAGDVAAGSTTSVVNVVTPAGYAEGQLCVWDSSASAGSPTIGWPNDITASAVTLEDPAAVAPTTGDNNYGTAVGYISSNIPVPLTIRRSGDNNAFLWSYIGCVAESVTLDLAAKKTAMCEIVWRFTDRKRYGTGGGLVAISDFQRVRPSMGNSGGRFVFDGSDTCGWHDLQLSLTWDVGTVDCLGQAQGVSEYVRTLTDISLSAKVPFNSADSITDNEGPFESAYTSSGSARVQITVGEVPGQIFSVRLPSIHVSEPPALTEVNGMMGVDVKMQTGAYTGDTGSTAPADVVLAIGAA